MIYSETIPSSMPAVVLEKPKRLVYREIPVWPIESYGDPDMVLIKVEACGICGSDLRYYAGENPWAQHTLGRHIDNPPNIVLGHEFAGVVVSAADERNSHLLGKRVAPICSKTCGRCSECRQGREQLCPNTLHLGHGQGWGTQPFYPGAYARYAPAWASTCYELPDNVLFEDAAMMDILAVCVHVAHRGEIQLGRPTLIIGAGPAGNGIAQAAKNMGASPIVVVDISQTAVEIASRHGVDYAINVSGLDTESIKRNLSGIAPEGFGSVFDSVGTQESMDIGLAVLGKAGTLVNMAVHDSEMKFNFMRIGSERKITTSCNFAVGDYPIALSWLANERFCVNDWLTKVSLEDVPHIFEELNSTRLDRRVFKFVITFWG